MPLIQKIEISNFLNTERGASSSVWQPRWPHQVFDLGGLNSALNIPNGKGKSSMVMAVLAMLAGDRKAVKEVRDFAFAPQRQSHYTHIRIQVLVSSATSGGADLLSHAGGEPGGDPMVFGVYGNSGENGELKFYSYQGRFEDCPIAHTNGFNHTFVDNKTFHTQLDAAPKTFPANRQEGTDRAWRDHVQTVFDMASLQQQLVYQKLRGAEGGHGYFDVPNPPGADYSASVFYERLAPELLVEGMGELGEEDERGIEDTIHTKASQLIVQKHKSEQQEKMLVRAGNTLAVLEKLAEARAGLAEAKRGYDEHRDKLSVEFATLKYVLIEKPIPGVPCPPDDALAQAMVMQEGKWFLPDRVMAEFTGEPASEVNRRSEERNGLALEKADRSQVIDFACHIKTRDARGKPNQLYSRDTALALMQVTSKFTGEWTRQTAIDALIRAFDWVETHGDTNPAREIRKADQAALATKNERLKQLKGEFDDHNQKWSDLVLEQSRVGEKQNAYRAMRDSGLFTEAELASPEETGKTVHGAFEEATRALDLHNRRMARLADVHELWMVYQHEHPETPPAALADRLQADQQATRYAHGEALAARNEARKLRVPAQKRVDDAKAALQKAGSRLTLFRQTAPAEARFAKVFGEASPVGLANALHKALEEAKSRINSIEVERTTLAAPLGALRAFREEHGDADPSAWLAARQAEWAARGNRIAELGDDLKELKILRAGLDKAVIVAGEVARKAAGVAGGDHSPLHDAIEGMRLDQTRRESAFTLFSALLHSPVYKTAAEARDAAARLENAGIEAPVFLYEELASFCRTGEISMGSAFAHTWLVGIRTRQVECLLDPSLVEREKASLDESIERLGQEIETAERERAKYSPESEGASRAREAAKALAGGHEAREAALADEWGSLNGSVPELEAKATPEMTMVIRDTERHRAEFAGVTEASLMEAMKACEVEESDAVADQSAIEARITASEADVDARQTALNDSNLAALQIERLRKLQAYIDHPEDNPTFMHGAAEVLASLETARDRAGERKHFRFDLAAEFLKQGSDYAQRIEDQINHHKTERDHIQDTLLPEASLEIEALQIRIIEVEKHEREIDRLVRELMRSYRSYAEWSDDMLDVGRDAVLATSLGAQSVGLHEARSASERLELLEQMIDEFQFEEDTGSRKAMNDAKTHFEKLKLSFENAIDLGLVTPDTEMSEHMRAELIRAKRSPDIVGGLHVVAKTNYDKSKAANEIAHEHLETEWDKIGEWLTNFTKRLKKNVDLMRKVFAPKIDADTKEILNSGFHIEAKVAEDADIRAVLDGVVATIEKAEKDRAGKSFTSGEEKKQKSDLRQRIRNEFYRSVITDVRIKVCMPSISKHPLALERKMASTGQGIAMALLWIVKIADFTTKRWLNEQSSSAAQRKRMRHTQFTIIDGAFSSLSDEGLIKDALNSIEATKGNFQLIITDHDPDYRNNFNYFPTLIVAKEFGGRFMLAERKTKDLTDAASAGLPKGALGVMSVRAVPKKAAAPVEA